MTRQYIVRWLTMHTIVSVTQRAQIWFAGILKVYIRAFMKYKILKNTFKRFCKWESHNDSLSRLYFPLSLYTYSYVCNEEEGFSCFVGRYVGNDSLHHLHRSKSEVFTTFVTIAVRTIFHCPCPSDTLKWPPSDRPTDRSSAHVLLCARYLKINKQTNKNTLNSSLSYCRYIHSSWHYLNLIRSRLWLAELCCHGNQLGNFGSCTQYFKKTVTMWISAPSSFQLRFRFQLESISS